MRLPERWRNFFKKHWGLVSIWILVLGWGFYFLPKDGQWLLGWDNLVPELDFSLNVSRQLQSVWQGYRGLGNVDGMAQGADLTRTLIIWFLDIFLPTSLLRYVWLVLMLGLGMSGAYYLIKVLARERFSESAGLVAGLFYGFNLATAQMFAIPFEPFLSFFGFFPWLLYCMMRLYEKPSTTLWFQFGLVSVLSSSAFMVQTMFLVYFIVLVAMGLAMLVKRGRPKVKVFVSIMALTILVHSYWLAPVVYYAAHHADDAVNSTVNRLSTPETTGMHLSRSSLSDVIGFKGYVLDYTDQVEGRTTYLLAEWVAYLQSFDHFDIWLLLGILSFVGLILGGIRTKTWWPLVTYVFAVGLLSRGAVVGERLYEWMLSTIPYFGQLFRAAFTKWSIPIALMSALGLGYLVAVQRRRIVHSLLVIGALTAVVVSMMPSIKNGMVYEHMYTTLPQEYFDLFVFMKTQPNGRVLTLPMHQVWGWTYHDWGYRGSGFIWHGLKQPVMDRAFDVWSPANEMAYTEISKALYREDVVTLETLLRTYAISYLLLDESVVTGGDSNSALFYEETKKLLAEMDTVMPLATFGRLAVYAFDLTQTDSGGHDIAEEIYPFTSSTLTSTVMVQNDGVLKFPVYKEDAPIAVWGHDRGGKLEVTVSYQLPGIELDNAVMINPSTVENSITIPYIELPDYVFIGKTPLSYRTDERGFLGYVEANLGEDAEVLLAKAESSIVPSDIYTRLVGKGVLQFEEGKSYEDMAVQSGDTLQIVFPENTSSHGFSRYPAREKAFNCDPLQRGSVGREITLGSYVYTASDFGMSCDYIDFSDRLGFEKYLLIGKVEQDLLRGLRVYVHNQKNKRVDFEQLVDGDFAYVINSSNDEGAPLASYDLRGYGHNVSTSKLLGMDLIPLNSRWLEDVRILSSQSRVNLVPVVDQRDFQGSYFAFSVQSPESPTHYWINQSFEEGWVAYMNGKTLPHVEVNGWANGWVVNPKDCQGECRVVVFFWPQYLEWCGMIIRLVTLSFLGGKAYLSSR